MSCNVLRENGNLKVFKWEKDLNFDCVFVSSWFLRALNLLSVRILCVKIMRFRPYTQFVNLFKRLWANFTMLIYLTSCLFLNCSQIRLETPCINLRRRCHTFHWEWVGEKFLVSRFIFVSVGNKSKLLCWGHAS